MIHHIVLFGFGSFPEGLSKEQFLLSVKKSFEELPQLIEPLKSLDVSCNINPAESYDLMLHGVLEREEDIPIYARHPEHIKRVHQYIKPYVEKRACVDVRE